MKFLFAVVLTIASAGVLAWFIFMDAGVKRRIASVETTPRVEDEHTAIVGERIQTDLATESQRPMRPQAIEKRNPFKNVSDVQTGASPTRSEQSMTTAERPRSMHSTQPMQSTPSTQSHSRVQDASTTETGIQTAAPERVTEKEAVQVDTVAEQASWWRSQHQFLRRVTVEIENQTADAFGSGVIIELKDSSMKVLTADHVLDVPSDTSSGTLPAPRITEPRLRVRIATGNQKVSPHFGVVRILNRDPDHDLAILHVELPNGASHLSSVQIYQGGIDELKQLIDRQVWGVKFPQSKRPEGGPKGAESESTEVVETRIEAVRSAKVSETAATNVYLRVSARSAAGMSGGGLFLPSRVPQHDARTAEGLPVVIGIASGNSKKKGYYVAATVLQSFLKKAASRNN